MKECKVRVPPMYRVPMSIDCLEITEVSEEAKMLAETIKQLIWKDAERAIIERGRKLDIECKAALKHSRKKIRGKLTKEKVAKAGFLLVHQEGVGIYFTQHGKRVSRIVGLGGDYVNVRI